MKKERRAATSAQNGCPTLVDGFNRSITYLRVSVTDRCNLRCTYCLPGDVEFLPHDELLTYEEIERVVAAGAAMGVRKVRITGGEPLVRKNLRELVRRLSKIENLSELTLTTNGILLEKRARGLRDAGLQRINVSLDTLEKGKYREICRLGAFDDVLNGIVSAKKAGLNPVKINVVVIRDLNDGELENFVAFSRRNDLIIRFIEYMPARHDRDWRKKYVSRDEILLRLAHLIDRRRMNEVAPSTDPARYYPLLGGGAFGVISPVSHNFCSMCNRLRLTPDGRLLACLTAKNGIDVRKNLRNDGGNDEKLREAFLTAIRFKAERGEITRSKHAMHRIGG
ncbi:MAG: GTP 3',8-cyclase MoaA [bacterium]